MVGLGALAVASFVVGAAVPSARTVSYPLQPVDGAVVTTETPVFAASVANGDPFPHAVVSTSREGSATGGLAHVLGSCWLRTPAGQTGEGSGAFGCTLPQPLVPGRYYWVLDYGEPVCAVAACASPQAIEGPFSFTVDASAQAPARPVPAALENVVVRPRAPRPGGTLAVTAELWVGGSPQDVVSAACVPASLHAVASSSGSRGGCRWRIPRSRAGRLLRGSLTLHGPAGSTATARFSVRVRAAAASRSGAAGGS